MLDKIWNLIENICRAIFSFGFRLIGREMTEEQMNGLMQFVKFGIVGVSNTLISTFTYMICVGGIGLHRQVAYFLGFVISVCNSFYWNNKYVFEGNRKSIGELAYAFVKMTLSYASTGLVLGAVLLEVWVQIFHIPEIIAPIVSLFITIPLNFVLNKLWAFKKKK